MKRWKKFAAGALLLAGLAPHIQAQAIPAAPVGGAAVAPAAAPAAAPQSNLWSFLCMTPEQKAACRDKICNCALGQMLNNGLSPVSTFSGGLVPSLCPPLKATDLLKPADSAEGAAARAKQDEADAKARREAVRYLGTVDCHYWPEAQEALVNALRGDRNECVRLEAAWALNRGCCCSKITIKALVNSVARTDEDGYPSENSERVLAAAYSALVHCLNCYTEVVPAPIAKEGKEPIPPKGEPVPKSEAKPAGAPNKLAANLDPQSPLEYYHRVQMESRQQLIAEGQRAVANSKITAARQAAPAAEQTPNGLLGILEHTFSGSSPAATSEDIVVQQPMPRQMASDEPHSLSPMLTPRATTTTVVNDRPMPAAPSMTIVSAPVPVAPSMTIASPPMPAAPSMTINSSPMPAAPTMTIVSSPMPAAPSMTVVSPPMPAAPSITILSPTIPAAPTVPAAPSLTILSPSIPAAPTVPAAPSITILSPSMPAAPTVPAPTIVNHPATTVPTVDKPVSAAPAAANRTATVWQASDSTIPSKPTPASPPAPTSPVNVVVNRSAATSTSNVGPNMTMAQVVVVLRESPHPEYREWAADNLATVDGWTHPTVVQALTQSVQKDQDPLVRAASVRALGHMRCGTMPVFSAVQGAMADTDANVRKEAEMALHSIGATETVKFTVQAGR